MSFERSYQWERLTSAIDMMELILSSQWVRLSERRYRLIACAVGRSIAESSESLKRIEKVERALEEGVTDWEAWRAGLNMSPYPIAACDSVPNSLLYMLLYMLREGINKDRTHADIVRDIVRNPWQIRETSPVPLLQMSGCYQDIAAITEAAYHDRSKDGTLKLEHLLPLSDVLTDAGYKDDNPVIEHLRGPGPHWRGCWVIDLLRGQE